ncbi:MAG: sugar phosphorylase [Kiritimatiellia bacterium]
MTLSITKSIGDRLGLLYGERAPQIASRLVSLLEAHHKAPDVHRPVWSERDVVLITYGDTVRSPGHTHLHSLNRFLNAWLSGIVNTVHILPFQPYSSDDGFSVMDYRSVNPELGDWKDIKKIGESFHLMADLVLNHVSAQGQWARAYREGHEKYRDYFIEMPEDADLAEVVRPRSLPLLTPVQTSRGTRHVWTTFSADQLDLDYSNPEVLMEMIDILMLYVSMGARIIRLDAIAYLWKKAGTCSIHLPETHAVVQLIREILEQCAPGVLLVTETNVPHEENVSYFGDGTNEAHMVYQFALPPLVLYSLLYGDARVLSEWAGRVRPPTELTTFFNFTASHDGVGLRPLEGIVPEENIRHMISEIRERGGLVSTRKHKDGTDSPYELNVSYFSAMRDPGDPDDNPSIKRFLASQAIALALQGMPALYFHSVFATPNAHDWVKRTGSNRSINRRKYGADELHRLLREPGSSASRVYESIAHIVRTRTAEPSFHPNTEQQVLDLHPSLFAIRRGSIIAITNVSKTPLSISLHGTRAGSVPDILNSENVSAGDVPLGAYETRWLKV